MDPKKNNLQLGDGMHWLANDLDRFSCGQDVDAIFDALLWGAMQLGFEHCEVVVFAERHGKRLIHFQRHNYPPVISCFNNENPQWMLALLFEKLSNTQIPQLWDDELFSVCPDTRQHCQAHGLCHGVTRMVQGLHGCNTLISLCRREDGITAQEFYDKVADVLWLTNLVHGALAPRWRDTSPRPDSNRVARPQLSSRELEVLKCASQGMTSERVATALAVSQRTVNFHIARCIEKLGASNKLSAVVKAMQHGLI
ncbi:helix-turn-helix transcriptional regulator [Pseudomonas eucalypticola]|uniref:Autoinducer binding domain-containing protein n=1 Tax=Pseudomonas eucalypticola TaxID=2599595 RepID=A0A7D5D8P5_9PSED|nr:LuxR family transcriptional regulator [Pseudomonas eucalypticola]QKZ06219.1 autoinducer binding domain-containing protein [Pseudomonas eucalypticola]